MKKYYIVEAKILSSTGEVLTVDYGLTYNTLAEAAQGQKDHIDTGSHVCVGFRVIELQEVEDEV